MTVKDYMAKLAPAQRKALKALRAAIRDVVPAGADEVISYGIPAFKVAGKGAIYYAAWKAHASLYPITNATQKQFAKQLEGMKTSKGTVQFPLDAPIPVALVKQLVKARLAEVSGR